LYNIHELLSFVPRKISRISIKVIHAGSVSKEFFYCSVEFCRVLTSSVLELQ
jgi:hypothetical protein